MVQGGGSVGVHGLACALASSPPLHGSLSTRCVRLSKVDAPLDWAVDRALADLFTRDTRSLRLEGQCASDFLLRPLSDAFTKS